MSSMADRFLAARDSKMFIQSIGDAVERTASDDHRRDRAILAVCRKAVTDYRVFDLRSQWAALWSASFIEAPPLMVSEGYDVMFQKGAERTDVPFLSQPRLGIHGWYQMDDVRALLAVPDPTDPDGTFLFEIQELDGGGDHSFSILGGAGLDAGDDGWSVFVDVRPINLAALARFDAMTEDQRQEWLYKEVPYPGPQMFRGVEQSAYLMAAVVTVLLANTIVQADPKVFRTEVTPGKMRKAREKRSGHRGARAKSWINLPGLRYDSKTGRWSAPASHGVAWHMVRGHPRTYTSDRYKAMKGATVWIAPHSKGSKDLGVSTTPYKLDRS